MRQQSPEEEEVVVDDLQVVYRKRADAARGRGHAALRPSLLKSVFVAMFGGGAHQGGGGDYDAAAEHFKAAAGGYLMVKDWAAAAECLRLHAEALIQLGQPGLAAGELVEAAHCCARADDDAAPLLRLAADVYISANRFDRAARCLLEMASDAALPNERRRLHYAEAADLFEKTTEGGDSTDCRNCRVKLAELAASDAEAADIFERLGRDECIGNNRRRHGGASYLAKKFFLQSLLCHLAQGDVVQARQKQEQQFADLDCTFPGSRENAFVTQLIAAMDSGSAEAFAEACADFDRVTPLDEWKTAVLLRAKRHLMGEEEQMIVVDLR